MGDCTLLGITDGLRIAPQATRLMIVAARLPQPPALGELRIAQRQIDRALLRIDRDHVAVEDQADRSADRRLRPDMADAEAVCGAREAAIGHKSHLVTDTLAVEGRR